MKLNIFFSASWLMNVTIKIATFFQDYWATLMITPPMTLKLQTEVWRPLLPPRRTSTTMEKFVSVRTYIRVSVDGIPRLLPEYVCTKPQSQLLWPLQQAKNNLDRMIFRTLPKITKKLRLYQTSLRVRIRRSSGLWVAQWTMGSPMDYG